MIRDVVYWSTLCQTLKATFESLTSYWADHPSNVAVLIFLCKRGVIQAAKSGWTNGSNPLTSRKRSMPVTCEVGPPNRSLKQDGTHDAVSGFVSLLAGAIQIVSSSVRKGDCYRKPKIRHFSKDVCNIA